MSNLRATREAAEGPATALPAGPTLASTFDRDTARESDLLVLHRRIEIG